MINIYDAFKKVESPDIYLCTPSGEELYTVIGSERKAIIRFNQVSELTMDVYQKSTTLKGESFIQPCYEFLETKKLLFVSTLGWFVITSVSENDGENGVYKTINAKSHEYIYQDRGFFSEERVYCFYNNNGDVLDAEYDSSKEDSIPSVVGQLSKQLGIKVDLNLIKFDSEPVIKNDYKNWTLVYIDPQLKSEENKFRTLKESNDNGYNFMINIVEEAFEMVWEFDYLHHAIKAKKITSITTPTDIYLSFDNLVQEIEVTENADDLITVLNCNGEGIDITAVNPMGTNYLVNFDYFAKQGTHWMSKELTEAIDEWKVIYRDNEPIFNDEVNKLYEEYKKKTEIAENYQNSKLLTKTMLDAQNLYSTKYDFVAERVFEGEKSQFTNSIYYSKPFDSNEVSSCYKKSPASKIRTNTDGTIASVVYDFSGLPIANKTFKECFLSGYLYFQDEQTNTYCKIIKKSDDEYGFERKGIYEVIKDTCQSIEDDGIITTLETVELGNKSLDDFASNCHSYYFDKEFGNYRKAQENDINKILVVDNEEEITSQLQKIHLNDVVVYIKNIKIGDYVVKDDKSFVCYTEPPILKDGIFVFDDNRKDFQEGTLEECIAIKPPIVDENYTGWYLYFVDGSPNTYCKLTIGAKVDVKTDENTYLSSTTVTYYVSGFTRFGLVKDVSKWINEKYTGINADYEKQLENLEQTITNIKDNMQNISELCNIRKFLLNLPNGSKLLEELDCYWFVGDYTNDAYAVSDDTSFEKVVEVAKSLKTVSEDYLTKISQPKFSFRLSVVDFTKLIDFKKFASQLEVGKTITVEKQDGLNYVAALTEFSYDLDNGDDLSLIFANSAKINSNEFTFADLVIESSSVSKDITANWQDLMSYAKNKSTIDSLIYEPLNLSLRAGLSNAVNQEFIVDSTGILGRKYIDESKTSFANEQMRVSNNSILFTDDNWNSVKTALGKIYYDNDGKEETAYGLIGETIIGSLIMGETLKIKNPNSSILLDSSGITITNGEENTFVATNQGDVSISGVIHAKSGGTIGGFDISDKFISHDLENPLERVLVGCGKDETEYDVHGNIIKNLMLLAGENFAVTNEGKLFANDVNISGKIHAEEGVLGRLTLDGSAGCGIYNDSFYVGYSDSENRAVICLGGTIDIESENITTNTKTILSEDSLSIPSIVSETGNINTLSVATSLSTAKVSAQRINTTKIGTQLDDLSEPCYIQFGGGDDIYVWVSGSYANSNLSVYARGLTSEPGKDSVTVGVYFTMIGLFSIETGQSYKEITVKYTDYINPGDSYNGVRWSTGAIWGVCRYGLDTAMTVGGKYLSMSDMIVMKGNLIPLTDGDGVLGAGNTVGYSLGNGAHRWDAIYSNTSTIQTSDKNLKNSIQDLTETHSYIFDNLRPVTYKLNANSSNRTHTGLIAQELKETILNAGLSTSDFAAYCEWVNDNGDIECGIRYEELIALCIREIQALKQRIKELTN